MGYVPILDGLFKVIEEKRAVKLHYLPKKISIEPGNICNLRCPLCPTNDVENRDIPKSMMSLQTFQTIFDKVKPFVLTLDFFNWGEPFLNKDIGLFVKYVKEQKPKVRIVLDSNFNIISDEQIDQIVRYGLDVIHVSCDGATQPVYEQYRIGGNIERVIANMRKLVAKKKELKSDKLYVEWKYLVFKHNQHEVGLARDKAKEIGVGFSASGMRINCGKEIFEDINTSVKRDKKWIPDDPAYNNYKIIPEQIKRSCPKPWKTLTVDWNGDVVPCGALYDCAKYNYGNLVKQSFDEVWNGEKYLEARRVILSKKDKAGVVCSICKSNGYQFF
ncbi:MAG: radical SAM protein [Candidatus Omnitrophica bacterium]|nr:radical SAM protein [Candidatus Omnitrophota bacterium]